MYKVEVPRKLLVNPRLPLVCVTTGATQGVVLRRVWLAPPLAYKLLLMAVFPPLLLMYVGRSFRAWLPMTGASYRKYWWLSATLYPVALGGFWVAVIALLSTGSIPVLVLGLLVFVSSLVWFYTRVYAPAVPAVRADPGGFMEELSITSAAAADAIRAFVDEEHPVRLR